MTDVPRPSRSLQYASRYPGADASGPSPGALAVLHRFGTRIWPPEFPLGAGAWLLGSRPCPCRSGPVAVRASVPAWPTGRLSDNEPGHWAPAAWLERFLASEAFSRGDGPKQLALALSRFIYRHLALAAEGTRRGERGCISNGVG